MKSNINFSYLIFLSVVAALGGFLFGYDAAVISGTISQVTVKFGLDEIQIGWFVGCALIGSIIGVLFAGKLSDMWGRKTLSKILCKWKQDSAVSLFLYLDSVFKNKHKLIHNQAPVMNRLCPFLLNLHK